MLVKPASLKTRTLITAQVATSESGYLFCREHMEFWCDHVAIIFTKGGDADALFDDLHKIGRDNYSVIVPVIPSKSLYASVWLKRHAGTSDTFKAWLTSPDDVETRHRARKDEGDFLGFVSQGEGRAVIRQLILQDFVPFLKATPAQRCQSPQHTAFIQAKIAKEFRETQDGGDAVSAMLTLWCLKFYDKCGICFVREGASNSFDPDLIPT